MNTSILRTAAIGLAVLLGGFFSGGRAVAASCTTPGFPQSGTFTAGDQPIDVAVGDFNGDGRADLVVANQFSGNVSVFLGNGNGTFASAVNYAAGSGPSSVAVGHFNGDGRLDLAVTDVASTMVWVLMGNANGTFQTAVGYEIGFNSQSVGTGDFNLDGRLDLAVVVRVNGSISVLFGNGNGTFQTPPAEHLVGLDPFSLAVGDFNKDGPPDLAVANAALFDDAASTVSILRGRSTGNFFNAVDVTAGVSPRSIAVGDFNGDTNPDMAVANYGAFPGGMPPFTNSTVSILLGAGNTSFAAPVNMLAEQGPVSIAAADLNGDSKLDLAVVNLLSFSVSVFYGNGNGTFAPPLNFDTGPNPHAVAVGEFNGDGMPDLVVAIDAGAQIMLSSCVQADMALGMTGSPSTILLGEAVTYTINVTNRGPTAATSATLTNRLPTGMTFSSLTTTLGSCAHTNGVVGCGFGTMASGAQATVTITVTANGAATITNIATAASTLIDPIPSNNTARATTTVLPIVSISAPDSSAAEAGPSTGFFRISRAGGTAGPLTVNFSIGGTASNGTDYSTLSNSVTIPNGAALANIVVSPVDDADPEESESVVLTLSPNAAYAISPSGSSATVTIVDNDVYAINISDATVTEGDSGTVQAMFTVSLSPARSVPVTANYSTLSGTAFAGSDFVSTNGLVTFNPGVTNQTVIVTVLGDLLNEANETFFVNLANATNGMLVKSFATGTINNNDPLPALSINDMTLTEVNSGTVDAVFTVSLSALSGQTVSARFDTANGTAVSGTDYASTSGVLIFPSGITNQSVTVQVLGDTLNEANEIFLVNLSNPTNTTIADPQGMATIQNDDPVPGLSIDDATLTEGNSGSVNANFTVRLTAASGQSVSVNFATASGTAAAGSDYVSTNGTVNFAAGVTALVIPVRITGDTRNELDETFTVILSGTINANVTDSQSVGTILNDDPLPAIAISNATVTEGDSGTTDAVFTVSLSAISGQSVAVQFATADVTTSAGSDYMATNGILTFAEGVTNLSLAVKVSGDLLNEINEEFFVNLTNPTNATIADSQGLGTISNNDPLPGLSMNDVAVTEGDSGTVNAAFTVSLSAASGQTVAANFATADGNAVAGNDYVAVSGTVIFQPGVTNQSILVQVVGDLLNELDETFAINLFNPDKATFADAQGVGTINNNDPLPSLSIADVSVPEGDNGTTTNAVFTVSLSAVSGRTVTVNFATADGTATAGLDYAGTNGALTFPPGTATRTVTVQILGDDTNELHETFSVNLSNAGNATLGDGSALGTILDDDSPAVTISDATVTEGNSGTTNAVFTLTLSYASALPASINFSTANGTAAGGSDYVITNGIVNFPTGTTNQTLTVRVNGDVLSESNETFFVNLSNPTNAIIAGGPGLGTIEDQDPLPVASILDVTVAEGNSGTANAVFNVRLSTASGQEVSVDYATANGASATAGADYFTTNGTVTFPPGVTNQTVTVPIVGDLINEANETFSVNLSGPFRATLGDSTAIGTITDNDPMPGIRINDVSAFEGNSGTADMVFTLSLTAASGQSVSVTYATADGTAGRQNDYVRIVTAVATFSPGQTNQPINVVINGDTTVEPNETLFVNLSSPVNATLADSQGQGTILNDEGLPTVSITNATIAEGNSGVTDTLFNVRLSASYSQAVTVNYATASGTAAAGEDYLSTNGVLNFPAGTTNQTVTVKVLGELLNELNETFFVNLTSPVLPITDGQGLGTINNDDAQPSIAINDVTLAETTSGITNAVFTVMLSAASGQTVTVNYATAADTATAGSDFVATNGSLSFSPGATARTIVVPIFGDMDDEPDETFFINLSTPSNATISDSQGIGTILNGISLPTASVGDVTVTEGNSGSINAVFSLTLSLSFTQQVTVNFSTADGTAAAGPDYRATNGIAIFAPGTTNLNIPVAVFGDTINESNEMFTLNLSNPMNAFVDNGQGMGTINNDDPLPSLTINNVTVTEGSSGTTNAVFTVTLSPASGQTVTVNFATADGSANAGSDYASANGNLNFAPGVTTRTITVPVNGDALSESDETFVVNLSGAVNATIGDNQGTGTISNDDLVPGISIANATLNEGDTGVTIASFAVTLSSTYPQTVSVNYATANGTATAGSDYVATNGLLNFAPGTTSQNISVRIFGDSLNEPNETFSVNLSNPSNATIVDGQGTGTITNDDGSPTLSIGNATLAEGDSGTSDANFTVTLSAASGQTVTVNYATANGSASSASDYISTNGVLSFASGATSQTITVKVRGDVLTETNETFLVNLSNPSNATIADGQGQGTILDDESLPSLLISDVTLFEGNAGTTNAVFTVSLSLPSAEIVSVRFSTTNGTASAGSDYVATNGLLNFDPGTTTQEVTVRVLGDTINEDAETFFVNLSSATNAVIADTQGRGIIDNDDSTPALTINDVTVTEGNSGTANAVFTVGLFPASGQTVTVNFATADGSATAGSDYAFVSGLLTFAPGVTNQTISVAVNGDVLNEPDETFFVNLSSAANALLGDAQGLGTISNNDPLPMLSINDVTVTERDTVTTNAIFTVSLSAISEQTVVVNFATANGTATAGNDYTSTNGSLTFLPGTTNQTITVQVNNDDLTELNETFFVNLTIALSADISDSQGVGTIINDDPPAISINDVTVTEGNTGTSNAVFTVSLSAASGQSCTVNFATADGTALAGNDYFSTNGTLTFPSGTITQTVTVRIISDTVFESAETFFVDLSSPANATLMDNQALGTISNNDPLPALFINDIAVTEVDSGSINATFSVRLSTFSSQPVTVEFATANGTGSAGLDYVSTNGSVTFAPGSTNQTISVAVLGDLLNEPNETYFVNLSNPTGGTISDGQGLGTINNDDSVPSIAISDTASFEGNSGSTNFAFTLSLSAASGQQISVNYATTDGTATRQSGDYIRIVNATAVFTPGQTNQTISVTVGGDTTVEPNETFFVDLSSAVNATVADSQATGTILNDDGVPNAFVSDATVAEGNSGTANLVFNVRLSTNTAQTVTIGFSTAEGTAVAGVDYLSTNGVLTFAPNSTNQTITVRAVGDPFNELNETLFVNLMGSTNAFIVDGQAVGTISNDDPLPAMFIDDVTAIEGDEGVSTATFTVRLVPASGRDVAVNYATASGTALAGSDYLSTNGTLNFVAGTTSQTVVVAIQSDVLNEAAESFVVNLSSPANATITDGQATGTISNDDPLPTLSINDVSLVEGNSGTTSAIFTVSLSALSGQTVNVSYATTDGTAQAGDDYTATNGTLGFPPGTTNQFVVVAIQGDLLNEAEETLVVNLTGAINATLLDNTGLGTILNDDPLPTLSIADVTVVEDDSGTTNALFTVSLSAASGQNVTINYATADGTATAGSDYIGTNGSLSFTPGVTSRTITVPVLGDVINETNESFSVNLSIPVNTTIGDGQGVGTINNDDPLPTLVISDVSVTEADSGTTDAVFTVSLSAVSGQMVTVNYATVNGTAIAGADYVATNATISFAPGTTNQSVTVKVIGELFNELDETFQVNLSNPGNATLADSSAQGTIVNNDPLPTLSLSDANVAEGNSGATAAVFTVTLSAASGRTITVNFATANATALAGVDYVATNGTITLAAGTTNQTITVAVLGDTLDEANESFSLTLSNPSNATLGDAQGIGTINDDDPAPALSVNDVAVTEGDGGAVQAVFTVSLSAASGRNVSVNYAMSDGTATAGSDYVATSGTLNFTPGATSQVVQVTVLGDVLNEANESFFLTLSLPVNATIGDGQGVATVNNDDPMPTLSIADMVVTEGDSGTTEAVLVVTLSTVSGQAVTVEYATTNGTAVAGTDYIAANDAITFEPGETVQTITILVNGDVNNEVNETFFVDLIDPGNAILTDGQGRVTINNNDPLPTLSIQDVTVTEGNSGAANALFRVSLSVASGQAVSVHYATADGTALAGADYVATNGTVTFAPGTTNQDIAVAVLGDALNEAIETFLVSLSSPTNALLGDSDATGTVDNNDPLPALAITDVTVTEGDTGTADALFTVSLSAASGQTVTVNYSTANGTATAGADYVSTNGTVTFLPGATSQQVLVKVLGDTLNESSETFFVDLASAVNATLGDGQGRGTINNDDPLPSLSIGDESMTEGDSGISTVSFTVNLSAVSGQPVTFNYSTASGTAVAGADYISTNGLASIAAGEMSQTITVRINGDVFNESDETFFVNLSNPTNAVVGDGQAVGTINNDDPLPVLSINSVTVTEGNTGTTNAIFTVSLSPASGQNVTVNYASSNGTAIAGSDYFSTNGTLTFAPGVLTQSVTVRVSGDLLSEASETFFVTLSEPDNATLGDGQGVGTITDTDPLPALFINDVAVSEGNNGTSAIFTVRLATASGQPVTVNFATASGTATADADYISTNGTVTFPPGNTNQTVAVAIVGELSFEANETFTVNLSSPVNATISDGQGTGMINNDDPVPSISIRDASGFEGNSGTTSIVFTFSLSAVSGQSVTVTYATADGTATRQGDYIRVANGTVVFSPGQSNQTISITVEGDTTVEANETFFVDLSSPVNATIADSQAQGLILNDDGVPSIFINDATVTEGDSGTTNAVFTVRLSAASSQAVTMSYATANGTAVAGSDYIATNGVVNFPAGTTNQTITVRVLGDLSNESSETFFVNLSTSTNGLINDGVGAGTIVDNDSINLVLSTNSLTVPEGGTNSFSVRLSAQPSSNIVVTTRFTSGDTDLGVSGGSNLVFNSANWNVDQPVVLSASEDSDIAEGQALFTVSAVGLTDRTVTARELENDAQGLVVSSSQNYTPPPRITDIRLAGANTLVRFTTILSNSYRLERSDVVVGPWTPASDEIMGTGNIVEMADNGGAGEQHRFYRARLMTSTGVSIAVPEGGTANFTVRLSAQPTNTVTVTVARTSGSTGINISGGSTLTFNPENWNVPQTVMVNASEDPNTTDEDATITISSPGLPNQTVNATALDNDLQGSIQCPGDNVILQAMAPGDVPFIYQWRKDGQPLPGETNSSLVLTNLMAADAGAYSVEVIGELYTFTKSGTLAMNTPTSASPLDSLTLCQGATASFNTTAAGSGPFSFQWRKGGVDLIGATNNTLMLPNVSDANEGNYCVVVSGACNRVTNCASLAVLTLLSATGPPDLTSCQGSAASLVVTARGSGPFAYQWSKNGTDLPGQTSSNLVFPNVSSLDAGNYCVVVNGPCNRLTNCATLTVPTPMSATGPFDQVHCPGEPASLSVLATGSAPLTYQWSKASVALLNETNSTLQMPNVTALDAGSYCVVVSGPCNRVTNCANLTVRTPLSAAGPVNQTSCAGTSASFTVAAAGSGSLSYQWSKGGVNLPGATSNTLLLPNVTSLDAGSYCVVVSGPCNRLTNCASLTVLTPVSAIGPFDEAVCSGGSVAFSVEASGSGPLTYQWSKAGVDLPGETNPTLVLASLSVASGGTYCVVVGGACNRMTNCATLTVTPTPSITAQPANQFVFVNSNASFSVTTSGTGSHNYQWRFNGEELPGETASALTILNSQPANEGLYSVVISDMSCSVTSAVARLTLFRDFGDAPSPAFPTLLASNGASHLIVPGFHLGGRVDAESDGQPNTLANGDDLNGNQDDEDGVTFATPVVPGLFVTVSVVASADGRLDGWLDFNGNGSWNDSSDRIFMDEPVSTGVNILTFPVPLSATLAPTIARFRFGSVGGGAFNGPALDGEVEDHMVDIVPLLAPADEPFLAGEDPGTTEPPQLAYRLPKPIIADGNTGLIISWSFPSIGYVLESATSLSPPDWQPTAELPILVNECWEVSIPIDRTERYFRLRKP